LSPSLSTSFGHFSCTAWPSSAKASASATPTASGRPSQARAAVGVAPGQRERGAGSRRATASCGPRGRARRLLFGDQQHGSRQRRRAASRSAFVEPVMSTTATSTRERRSCASDRCGRRFIKAATLPRLRRRAREQRGRTRQSGSRRSSLGDDAHLPRDHAWLAPASMALRGRGREAADGRQKRHRITFWLVIGVSM
jgi:hypothetical protein